MAVESTKEKNTLAQLTSQKTSLESVMSLIQQELGWRTQILPNPRNSVASAIEAAEIAVLEEEAEDNRKQLQKLDELLLVSGLSILERLHAKGRVAPNVLEYWRMKRQEIMEPASQPVQSEIVLSAKEILEEQPQVIAADLEVIYQRENKDPLDQTAVVMAPSKLKVRRARKTKTEISQLPVAEYVPTRDTNFLALGHLVSNPEAHLAEVVNLYQSEASSLNQSREISLKEVSVYLKRTVDELFDNLVSKTPDEQMVMIWNQIKTDLGLGSDFKAFMTLCQQIQHIYKNGNGNGNKNDEFVVPEPVGVLIPQEIPPEEAVPQAHRYELEDRDPIIRTLIDQYIKEITPIMGIQIRWTGAMIQNMFSAFAGSWNLDFIETAAGKGIIKMKPTKKKRNNHTKYSPEDVVALLYYDQSAIQFNGRLAEQLRKIIKEELQNEPVRQAESAKLLRQDLSPTGRLNLTDDLKRKLGLDEESRAREKVARKLVSIRSRIRGSRLFEGKRYVSAGEILDVFKSLDNKGFFIRLVRKYSEVLGDLGPDGRQFSESDVAAVLEAVNNANTLMVGQSRLKTWKQIYDGLPD